jgi:outer membrane protein OmpA-like peptidoglycan-associated protein
MLKLFYFILVILLVESCGNTNDHKKKSIEIVLENDSVKAVKTITANHSVIDLHRQIIKLGHHINTSANEYLPVLSSDENALYFTGMDRTGFFDFKLDYTIQNSSGGEDIFLSIKKDGIWTDARPVIGLNTNSHEVISQVLNNNDLILTANYPENLGPKNDNNGTASTDLFFAKKSSKNSYQIIHFPEPINSIYDEADGIIANDETYIIFVSDKPGNIGEYHKKGWKWNNSYWGNTDVYVSLKEGDFWSVPINLGNIINTSGAERTPWLSEDGLTLFVSSNGHNNNRTDLNVFAFKRSNINDWKNWTGPIEIVDANSDQDDWGYKVCKSGNAYLSRAITLGFKPTQAGASGDGGIRETNFRSGYEIFGQQIASLSSENSSDIYLLKNKEEPVFSLPEVFFDFNSAKLKPNTIKVLDRFVDLVKQNKKYNIVIKGYTDDIGEDNYNLNLSQNRSNEIKQYFIKNNITNSIFSNGFGESSPKL